MGIQRLFSQLRTRISGAAKMDEDSLKDEEKGIELSEPLPNDGTGRSTTPSSEDAAPDLSGQSAGVATLDEPPPSDLPDSAGNEEPVLTDVPSGSASAETDAGIQPPVPFEKFQEVLESREKLYDRFLRKQAEFENFRKRTEKEKQEFYDFALSHFIKELLPVLDGLDRALYPHEGETVESYKEGMELILKQFRDVVSSVGLQPIRAIGTIFDPNYHQAVMSEENNNLAENEIIEELQRGYTFKDRLLRPSMVKVAVPAASATSDESPPEETSKLEGS
jgi:molecular chaperone GrpE